jgi:predicted Ser/Thr protein kinase
MLRMGTIFGRYRIEGVAGTGGMGVVYRATDTETGHPAALKVVSSIRTLDDENRERLLREAQLVARIDHPGVVPVYEAGEHDGHFYLAMLWVDGSDLEQLLSDLGPLPIERAVEVIANVADALDAAHERGFVHRDVKPANVLVADSGQVYLSDFGLTKVLDASTGLTHTGQLLGTVDYVAPEQIEGRPVDGRADVYSLGGLAYRAITGSVPFDRPGGVARLWAHLNVPAPSLRAKRPDAPRALDAAIRKALAKSPEERFATAGAFAIAAREALGEMAPAAVETGGIEEKVPVLAGAAGPMWEWEPPSAVEETSERSGRTVSLPFGRVRAPMALGLGYAMVVATVLGGVVLSGSGEKVQEVAAGAGKVTLQPSGTSEGSSSSPLAVAEPYILRAKPSGGDDSSDATASAASTETVTVPAAMNRAQRRAAARAEARSQKKQKKAGGGRRSGGSSSGTLDSSGSDAQQPARRQAPVAGRRVSGGGTRTESSASTVATPAPTPTPPATTGSAAGTGTPTPVETPPPSDPPPTDPPPTEPPPTDPPPTEPPPTEPPPTDPGTGTGAGTGTGTGTGTETPTDPTTPTTTVARLVDAVNSLG